MEEELKKVFIGMKRQETIGLVKAALDSGADPLNDPR